MPFRLKSHDDDDGARWQWLRPDAVIVLIVVLCAVVVGSDLYQTWIARSSEIEGSRREVANLAWSAAQHAEEAFRLADTNLVSLVERVEVDGTSPTQLERLRNVMASQKAASLILQGLTLIDENGDTIVNNLPVTRWVNVVDRAYYQHHLTHADRATFTSELLLSRFTGKWVISVSRRVDHADGGFAGIVSASVAASYFQDFYDSFDLGHEGSAVLVRDDGNILVRHPSLKSPGTLSLANTSLFRELLPKAASGSFELRSSLDGIMKIYAYRRVTGYPLVVVVALSIDEELATWRAGALRHLVAAITVASLLGFLAICLVRQMRLLTRAERSAVIFSETAARTASQFRLLAETATEMIITVDLRLIRRYVSPASQTLLGYAPEELLGESTGDKMHPEDAGRSLASLHLMVAGERDHDLLIYRVRHRDGHWVWVESARTTVRDPVSHAPCAINSALRDVSKRIIAEQEAAAIAVKLERLASNLQDARDRAEQANQAKSRFLTGITHELRTPLHGILGYAELLSLEGDLNAAQNERVRAMMAAGEHLLGMINAVLDVSQIEADRMELHLAEVELTELARSCLDVIRPSAETKGLSLVLTAPARLRILADSVRLRQVVINLLGNAIKFTSSGSVELRVIQTKDAGYARLEVADTGPGIRHAHMDKLFQTFERLNAASVISIEGAGIGLALAARLVELMGGEIGYADNPGGGSVFWLELPANGGCAGVVETTVANPRVAGPGLRVMVVDDDALNRDIASGFLRFGGHEAVCLDNGAAAVKAAGAEDFDIILMDVRMPGMNGLEATRLIRALPGPRGLVPILAASAQAYADQIAKCLDAGMNSHVSKPFKQAALLLAVEDFARGARATLTPGVVAIAAAPEFPMFDQAQFEDTTESLPLEDISEHMRTLIQRGEALLHGLRAPDMLSRAGVLAEAAHRLAGGAAAFGFPALADAGRRFEYAADSGMMGTVVADQLATAIGAAVTIMREKLAYMAAAAA